MILVNGSEGIGTGWSSFIPNYNSRDIVNNLKRLEEPIPMHPWYRGFQGDIEQINMEKYKVSGKIRQEYKENHTTTIVDFIVKLSEGKLREASEGSRKEIQNVAQLIWCILMH
ncbi:DNA topoisomerase, partial [Glomus cerebriforme]